MESSSARIASRATPYPRSGKLLLWLLGHHELDSGHRDPGLVLLLLIWGGCVFPGLVSLACCTGSIQQIVLGPHYHSFYSAGVWYRWLLAGTLLLWFPVSDSILNWGPSYTPLLPASPVSEAGAPEIQSPDNTKRSEPNVQPNYVPFVVFGLVYGASVLLYWFFLTPLCNVINRCGCSWVWTDNWVALGIQNCNVHNPSGSQCPFCTAPLATTWIPQWVGAFLTSVVVVWCMTRWGSRYLERFFLEVPCTCWFPLTNIG